MEVLELKNVTRVFRAGMVETVALDSITLSVKQGEFVSIMGPSGCGKSTLLNIMGALDRPSEGHVMVEGVDVFSLSAKEQARFRNQHMGFIFQSFHLIPSLFVYENVEMPLLYGKVGKAERRERITEMLERVGLSHRMHHFPNQISGGQCQRAAIARALVCNPGLILADEPTGNLDSKMGGEVMEILKGMNQKDGHTIVMVTHNEEQAKLSHRIVRMIDGTQVA